MLSTGPDTPYAQNRELLFHIPKGVEGSEKGW